MRPSSIDDESHYSRIFSNEFCKVYVIALDRLGETKPVAHERNLFQRSSFPRSFFQRSFVLPAIILPVIISTPVSQPNRSSADRLQR